MFALAALYIYILQQTVVCTVLAIFRSREMCGVCLPDILANTPSRLCFNKLTLLVIVFVWGIINIHVFV